MKYNRIYIIGTAGSGKTFMAKKLSQKYKIPHYDLDDILWKIKYSKKWSKNKRRKEIKKIADKKRWIIEGVYSGWINYALKKADLVIFIESNKILAVKRLILRFFKRRGAKENIRDLFGLIRFSLKYKPKKQMLIIKREGKKHLILKKYKDILDFISS